MNFLLQVKVINQTRIKEPEENYDFRPINESVDNKRFKDVFGDCFISGNDVASSYIDWI